MIQRIQTLWMVLTVALVSVVLFLPAVSVWLYVLAGITALVPLVTVFLYKIRPRQVSLLIAEFVLLAGSAAFTGYYSWYTHELWAFAPLPVFAAMLTNRLALRGVMHDELLVKSADRIR